LNSTNILTI